MKKRSIWILIALALLAALGIWLWWANTALEVTEITVRDSALPESFSGFRIAQVSDLHNAEFGEGNAELMALLQEEKPDIIVITGDLLDRSRTDMDVALDLAREMLQIAPCYYATGNHESAIAGFGDFAAKLEELGVTVLRNEAVTLTRDGEQIRLTGLDDYSFFPGSSGVACVEMMVARLEQIPGDGYDVLLFHRPELIAFLEGKGIELVLSGHAHGGQVRLPFVGGLIAPDQGWFPEYDAGLYSFENMVMVVSRGLGNSVVPLRVNNRPEVVMITLIHE